MVRVHRALRNLSFAAGALLVLGVGTLFFLTRTRTGYEVALERGLALLRDRIDGDVTVAGISTPSLISGVTLRGITITDAEGRLFLEVDSIQARYSLWGLLLDDIVFSRVRLWGPRVTLEPSGERGRLNVSRIFAPADSTPGDSVFADSASTPRDSIGAAGSLRGQPDSGEADTTESGGGQSALAPPADRARRIVLRRVLVIDGLLDIRVPTGRRAGDTPLLIEEAADGSRVQRLTFRGLQGDLPEVVIREPGRVGERFEIRSLSLVGEVLEAPFTIADFRGSVTRVGTSVRFEADRLWLPDSEAVGRGRVDWGAENGVALDLDLEASVLRLEDLRWLEPRLPPGGGRLNLRVEEARGGTLWRATGLDLMVGESRVRGSAGIQLGSEWRLSGVDLDLGPLDLSHLNPWLGRPTPIPGLLTGNLQIEGPLRALEFSGSLSHQLPGMSAPSTVGEGSGTLHLAGDPGVTDLEVFFEPFDYALVDLMETRTALSGTGSVRLQASGRLREGLTLSSRLVYRPVSLAASAVTARGQVRFADEVLSLDLNGEMNPLQLEALTRSVPEVLLRGQVSGSYSVAGRLSDMGVAATLSTSGGPLSVRGRVNLRDLGSRYALEGEATDLALSLLFPQAPDPTVLSGSFSLQGRGSRPEALTGMARVNLTASRIGHLGVDAATIRLQAGGGRLTADSLFASTTLGELRAEGHLGLSGESPEGELRLDVEAESIEGIRPFILGDSLIAADTLRDIEREILILEGIDVDTLPETEGVLVRGRARGRATLRGSIEEFTAEGTVELEDAVLGTSFVRRGEIAFSAVGLPRLGLGLGATLATDSLGLFGRTYQGSSASIEYADRRGQARLSLRRAGDEGVGAEATFDLGPEGVTVRLADAWARFVDAEWRLREPSVVSWGPEGLLVQELGLEGVPGPMEVRADGFLSRQGATDFRLRASGLRLARVAHLAQWDREIEGTLSLDVSVRGPAASPSIEGVVKTEEARYEGLEFSRIEGDVAFAGRTFSTHLRAFQEDRPVLVAQGTIPGELSLQHLSLEFPAEAVDLEVRADSLPAAAVMSFFEGFEEVRGSIHGELSVGGTVHDLEPVGRMELRDGEATITALGVRHRNVVAVANLSSDGSVHLLGRGASRGSVLVGGTLRVDSLSNPGFDLDIALTGFQAVERRDVMGRLSGRVQLTGSYRHPLVTGNLSVDEGALIVEELARAVEVVDLSNPEFFDVVDTTMVAVRPILMASRNPFLQNLRVDIDLAVERNAWIRSRQMNVEMAGELGVFFDRTSRDFVLEGTLQAVRGTYNAFGRQFRVQGGTVGFIGTPGLDPVLNIVALNRLRTPKEETIDITATVEGTLTVPRVTLSSDYEPPLSQSDLVSYLVFGRPSALLATGERSLLQGATGAVGTLVTGTFANQLASAVSQEIGFFDYLAVTSTQDVTLDHDVTAADLLRTTQIEVGRYWTEDLYLAFLIQPWVRSGVSRTQAPGVRLEWRPADRWTWQGFSEDRFFRQQVGLGDAGFKGARIFGFSLFWEGGY
jgi:hypothetical protein